MTTRLIQMDIVQLNIGSNPCTTPNHLCYFSYFTLSPLSLPFHLSFLPCYQSPLITKQVEQSGWTLTHVGCNANIQNHEMREPIAIAVQASHYTTLPLPFAFQYPQYINHFPFVSSLCQSESQHTSSTSSPKTLTKKNPKPTLTTTELNPTSLSLPLTRILNSDPQWRRILWILSFPLPGWYPPSPPRPGSGSSAMNSHRFLTIQVRHWLQNLVAEFKFYEMLKWNPCVIHLRIPDWLGSRCTKAMDSQFFIIWRNFA